MIPVSVVIVSYQTRELTLRCLAALRERCTTVGYETVVVDNGSTDGSAAAIAEAYPDVRLVRLADNVGFGRGVNAGAQLAGGRWLLLLNPDTEPLDDMIAALVRGAEANPDNGIYTGRTLRPDGSDDGLSCLGRPSLWSHFCFATGLSTVARRSRWFNPEGLPGLDRRSPAEVPAVSGCLALIDRELFLSLGGFAPEFFMYGEDVDLCTRAAARGARPRLVPDARVIHVGGASSSTASKVVMLFRGKTTYLRRHWPARRATVGRLLLLAGVALRAVGSRVTGRAVVWREVWARRSVWVPGWADPLSDS